jgi:hypothetical protein
MTRRRVRRDNAARDGPPTHRDDGESKLPKKAAKKHPHTKKADKGSPRPRQEGTPPNRSDERSLSLLRFLGLGRRAIGRQDQMGMLRESCIKAWQGGGSTQELGPSRPRREGTPPNRPDEGSLSFSRFLGWGRRVVVRQDPISAEITWWGLLLMWPKIFASLTNKKSQRF